MEREATILSKMVDSDHCPPLLCILSARYQRSSVSRCRSLLENTREEMRWVSDSESIYTEEMATLDKMKPDTGQLQPLL